MQCCEIRKHKQKRLVMRISEERRNKLISECIFSATRSSGPGGQNVNKVSSKVELRFALSQSLVFSEPEKRTLQLKLANRINLEGEIVLVSSVERSQWRNKETVIEKFFSLLEKALIPVKKRIKTSPTKASQRRRIEGKKLLSQKKNLRKRPEM